MAVNRRPRRRRRDQFEGAGDITDDSGIETMSVSASIHPPQVEDIPIRPAQSLPNSVFMRRRPMRIDDFLWFVCFLLTAAFFDIPNTLLFNRKVDWFYMRCLLGSQVIFYFLAAYFRVLHYYYELWVLKHVAYIRIPMILSFLSTGVAFCLATWQVYNVWSVYITFVTGMAFLALVAII
ncbi:hypothetical protein Ddc_00862 [Ditylenchus destructor]|nr:hypothetical protein Ddc_00862 [Ditylenchus destructor]